LLSTSNAGTNEFMARRQKTGTESGTPDPENDAAEGEENAPGSKSEPKQEAVPVERSEAETQPIATPPERPSAKDLPAIEPPEPRAEPWPDATPPPMKPVDPPELRASRTPTVTVAMPSLQELGSPPEMPVSSAPPPLALGSVEDPTHMPGPKDVPSGSPDDPAPPPGHVPPGDSRSLRRGNEFALIYRIGTCVISRTGVVGTRGQWRVVEYPTSASASSSYAKESSRFVSEGFSDYRA
jgi:hypothetical protein